MKRIDTLTTAAVALVLLTFVSAFQVFTQSRFLITAGGAVVVILLVGLACRVLPGVRRRPLLGFIAQLVTGIGILVAALVSGGALGSIPAVFAKAIETAGSTVLPMPDAFETWFALLTGVVLLTLVLELIIHAIRWPGLAILPIAAVFFTLTTLPGKTASPLRFALITAGMLGILMMDTMRRTSAWRSGLARDSGTGNDSADTTGRLGGIAIVTVIAGSLLAGTLVPILPNINLISTAGKVQPEDPRTDLNSDLHQAQPRDLLTYRSSISGGVHLRRAVLPIMDSTGFQSTAFTAFEATSDQFQLPKAPGLTATARVRNTQVTLHNSQQPYLPAPYAPAAISVKGTAMMFDKDSLTVFSRKETMLGDLTYGVQSEEVNPTFEEARNAKVGSADDSFTYLPTEYPETLRALAREITKDGTTPLEKASMLQSYFRGPTYTYSLKVTPFTTMGGYRTLQQFIVDDRVGYCEHFAVAMASMARVLGIPSRVAIGYTSGKESSTEKGLYVVSTENAHAWTELYFEGYGWMRFEPTPGVQSGDAPGWTKDFSKKPEAQATPTPTPTPSSISKPTTAPSTTPPPAHAPTDSKPFRFPWEAVAILGGVLFLAGVFSLPRIVRQRRRAAALSMRGHPEIRTMAAWEEIRDTAIDLKLGWEVLSPRAQVQRLRSSLGTQASNDMLSIALLVERSRFGHGLTDTGIDVGENAKRVVSQMESHATSRHQRRAIWLAPSLWVSFRYWVADLFAAKKTKARRLAR